VCALVGGGLAFYPRQGWQGQGKVRVRWWEGAWLSTPGKGGRDKVCVRWWEGGWAIAIAPLASRPHALRLHEHPWVCPGLAGGHALQTGY